MVTEQSDRYMKYDRLEFPFMDEIYYDSYEQFVKAVSDARARILDTDKEIIEMNPVMIDWNNMEGIPTGKFDTIYKGIQLECFMFAKEKAPLYVILSGANSQEMTIFARWSYYKFCSGSVLCIADPMLKMYENLELGWYYGNEKTNLRKIIADFVQEIAAMMEVDNENVVFIGSSGGGAPTFECTSYISGSRAVAINPQIVLKEWPYAEKFSEITGNNLEHDIIGHRNDALYYIKNRIDNQYLIIANVHSAKDMKQIENIKNALQISIQYGLNVYDNLIIWLYDADVAPFISPHIAQEYYCIWFFIEYILNHMNSLEVSSNVKALYRLVNEFWYDHWMLKRQHKKNKKNWIEFMSTMNAMSIADREIAAFGGGQRAQEILNDILDIQGSNYCHIKHIIDNDIDKRGKKFLGCTVEHPTDIKDWKKLYIIITTDAYAMEIQKQLEGLGLVYKEDFTCGVDLLW